MTAGAVRRIEEQGHSGYAWSVLGAAAQATSRLPLMTFVTCPTFRYHPAVVAQKAATMGILSGGRFTLGLGAGERLNEHVIGGGWPSARIRHQRLAEAAEIIRDLFSGDYVNYSGRFFEVDHARLFDLPDAARQWVEPGFTHLALVQVGAGQQAGFIQWAESELLPELRKLG